MAREMYNEVVQLVRTFTDRLEESGCSDGKELWPKRKIPSWEDSN